MNRRTLIRDSLMAIGLAILPKILRPANGEVIADDHEVKYLCGYDPYRNEGGEMQKIFILKKRRGGYTVMMQEEIHREYSEIIKYTTKTNTPCALKPFHTKNHLS
jgi:hypothetical protein